MFTSSICKHINKWGKNKGNICSKTSRKKDSRCHKHRYRFIQFLNRIYISFKYIFDIKPKIIKNKKQIKKILEEKEKNNFERKLEDEKENEKQNLKRNINETFDNYVNRIDTYTEELLKTKDNKIINKLIIDTLYKNLNSIYIMGTHEWTINANLILRIQRKYNFF